MFRMNSRLSACVLVPLTMLAALAGGATANAQSAPTTPRRPFRAA